MPQILSLSGITRLLLVTFLAIAFLIFGRQSFASTTATLYPVSDGNYTQWNPKSGSNHAAMVDETVCDGNTTFNRETSVGGRDSYGIDISSIPNGATITQIDITPCVSKNTSGGTNTTFDVFYRLDGVDSADAGAYSLSATTPSVQSTTSYTSLSIAKSGGTALEVGGVFTAGNRGSKLSQVAVVITYTNTPSVTTSAASSITQTTATFNSTVNPNGLSTTGNYRYGTSNVACSSLPNVTSDVGLGSGTSDVSNPIGIATLSANTTYYFCATATNSDGTKYGSVLNFTTLPNPPSVTTLSASNITKTTATLSATINPNGSSTNVVYRYGTSNVSCSSLPSTTVSFNIGSGTSDVSPNDKGIGSLALNTTYYYCATATNASGTTYGSVLSFTTLPNAPTVVTSFSSNIYYSTASVSGYVTPNGSSTSRVFRYGTSNVGCSSLPNTSDVTDMGSGTSQIFGTQGLNSLSASTTYYYCVSATNVGGTSYGSVNSFTTTPSASAPTVVTGSASSITSSSASISATINPNYGTTTRYFRYDTANTTCDQLANTTSSVGIGHGGTNVVTGTQINTLSANTTYYYCAVATNEVDTTYGSVNSFNTLP